MNLKKLKILDLSYFGGRNHFEGNPNFISFSGKRKSFEDNSGSDSSSIGIWKSLSNQSLNVHGSSGGSDDIKMSKPIRLAYVIFNHKR